MAAKLPPLPGFAALLRMAKGEGIDLPAETARQEATYKHLLKRFRSDVAELKKLGLLKEDINPRKVTPSAYLGRVRNEFLFEVRSGKSRTKKVSKAAAKNLRSQGYTVRKQRVLIRREETVRQNEVVPKSAPEGKTKKYAMKRIKLQPPASFRGDYDKYIDDEVNKFMAGLSPDDYFSVEIYGGIMSKVFHGGQKAALANWLKGGDSFSPPKNRPIDVRRIYIGGEDEAQEFNLEQGDEQYERNKKRERDRKRKSRAKNKKPAPPRTDYDRDRDVERKRKSRAKRSDYTPKNRRT
jgi:hypothetical protein